MGQSHTTYLVFSSFRFMDLDTCSKDIVLIVKECLNKGVNVLLPPMSQRIKIASRLLVLDSEVIKKSEQENLRLILQSINDPKAIGWLVLLCQEDDALVKSVVSMLQILLRKSSQLLAKKFEENGGDDSYDLEAFSDNDKARKEEGSLLFTLHVHFILFNLTASKTTLKSFDKIEEITEDYLKMVFTVGQDLMEHCRFVIKSKNGVSLSNINLIFQKETSLINLLHLTLVSLFDVPLEFTKKLMPELVGLHRYRQTFIVQWSLQFCTVYRGSGFDP